MSFWRLYIDAIVAHSPECSTGKSDFTSTSTDSVYSGDCLIASRVRLTKTFEASQLTRSINFGEISTSFPGHHIKEIIEGTGYSIQIVMQDYGATPESRFRRTLETLAEEGSIEIRAIKKTIGEELYYRAVSMGTNAPKNKP